MENEVNNLAFRLRMEWIRPLCRISKLLSCGMNKNAILPFVTAIAGTCVGYWAGGVRSANGPFPGKHDALIPAGLARDTAPKTKPAPDKLKAEADIDQRFTLLAGSVDPREALAQVEAAGKDKEKALAALLREWIKTGGMSGEKRQELLSRIDAMDNHEGRLVALASILEDSALAAYRLPFMEAFRDNPVRSAMFPRMVGQDASASPGKLAEFCRDWLPWEKTNFLQAASIQWAAWHPALARDWCLQNPGKNEPMLTEATSWLVRQDHEAGRRLLETSHSPVERTAAAGELGRILAIEDTHKAVEWANSLPEGPEKDAAHEAIYQTVPRGVGAILSTTQDGLPLVMNLMDEGPLSKAGFLKGDILAGIESPSGWQGFAAAPLSDVIAQLRGEPGTQLTVVAMRKDSATGQWTEFRKVVSREQLVIRSNQP